MEYARQYSKGGKVIIQPNDYQKYRKIGIENKYEIEAFNDIGLSGINFDSVTLNNLLEKKFNELLEKYEDYVISEDSEAITRTIQQEIEARKLQGDSLERIKEYEQMLTNKRSREQYIKDYANTQIKTLSEWVSYLKQSEYSIAFKYLVLKAVLNYNYDYKLNKLIERNNKTIRNFVGFDAASLAELNELNSDFLLKDYTETQANNSANILKSKDVIKSSGNGRWIKFNGGKKTNDEERDKNSKELSQLVQNTYWCTKTNSKSQLNGGDFYVYVTETNGEVFPRIAIRMDEDNVGEVRGNKSAAQDIEEEMLPIAEDFLFNNIPNDSGKKWLDSIKYNSSVIAFKERLIAEGTLFENSIELFFELKIDEKKYLVDYAQSNGNLTEVYDLILAYIKKLKNNLFYKKTNFHIGDFRKKDLNILTANGKFKFINLKYIFGRAVFAYSELKKLDNIIAIGGGLYIGGSEIKDLGNLISIGGDIHFGNSKVENLVNLKTIGGDADFENSKIESLGNLTTISGNANFRGSEVQNLSNLTVILGSSNFDDSKVENLGNLKYIGGVNFNYSKVKDLGNLTYIGDYAYFSNSLIKNLGNLITIGGDADFQNSKVENLENIKNIGGYAHFQNSLIKDLGNLTTIGGDADFSNSQIENLGNLTFIGGDINFAVSKVKNLGNLTTIGGNAYFDSKVENLGNLKTIGGGANFSNSKVTDLSYLTTINGDAYFKYSQVINLGNLTTIGGNAYFDYSKVENLGNLKTIGGGANFSNSKVTDLGNLTTIDGTVDFENTQIKNLGNLTNIGDNAYFENSQIENLGNLTTIGGDADFQYSIIENLGNLTTIGGDANFRNSKITNLGNLRNIGQSSIGFGETAYKLWVKRKKAIEKGKFEKGGYLEIDLAELSLPESLPDLLSSQEVENILGRKLHWWNDDFVYLNGTKYKKVYLRPEYKKVI
jgi:hypothetical protein